MRITVFGATGPAGQAFVGRALTAGHEIRAHARSPEKLAALSSERLEVVSGSLEADPVALAVEGADAVVSLLGPSRGHKGTPIAEGTRRIVAAMGAAGVRRLVAVATPSARDPRDTFDPRFALMVLGVRLTMRPAYEDIVATAEAVRASGLAWTLARLPLLHDGPDAGVHAAYAGHGAGLRLARAGLAGFLLNAAATAELVGAAPILSDRKDPK